ncbi:MAG: hypothetical protein AAB967_04010, partial [Patescibacteria group bacterium]
MELITVEVVRNILESLLVYIKKRKNHPQEPFRVDATDGIPRIKGDFKLSVIYSGIECESYNPLRRKSFEYGNFYETLTTMEGLRVSEYPFDAIVGMGKKRWNARLLETIRREKPDVFFGFMYTDEFDRKTLDAIKKTTKSIAWFADDHWRLHNYSRFYAPHFTKAVTTWSKAPERYLRYGITNVIRSQWALNHKIWKPMDTPRDIGVSFVGQYNEARGRIVNELRRAGVDVWVRGWGWPEGRLTQTEMVCAFSRSKINLNFNTPPSQWRPKLLGRLFFRRSLDKVVPDLIHVKDNIHSWVNMKIPQIKARPFEILGCRTFLISAFADDMDSYYRDGEEIVYYD